MTDLTDLVGTENEIFAAAAKTFKFKEMVKGDKGEGLQIFAKLKVHKAKKIFVFKFKNISKITLEKIYLTFDKNFLGLVPAKDFELKDELRPGSEQQIEMVVKKNFGDGIDENRDGNGDGDKSVQIGLKTDLSPSIKYFKFPFDDAEIEALIK
ncbi:hypothetical protein MHBO_002198 [Bonamia ostreae]|uniref:Uncharacterized protein n=1 Tax=Bonamia ostreae TaxID=126728 RepID=A0ABV2ALH2_9EUKA